MSNVAMTTIATGIRHEGTDIEEFREFNYLGSTITQDGKCDREVLLRIAYVGGLFSQLKNIWRCRYFSQKLKLQLFRSNVLSVLLYRYESCSLSKNSEKRLLDSKNDCLLRILAGNWTDRVTNPQIRTDTEQPLVTDEIRMSRWKYCGHMTRMIKGRLPYDLWCWTPTDIRSSGRQRSTLGRSLEKEARSLRTTLNELWSLAQDRSSWRSTITTLSHLVSKHFAKGKPIIPLIIVDDKEIIEKKWCIRLSFKTWGG